MKKSKILLLLLLVTACLSAQDKKLVTGNVLYHDYCGGYTDAAIGASVYVEGSNGSQATTTGIDGDYKIQVSADDVLVFQYIGAKTHRERVGERSVIYVVLEEDYQDLGLPTVYYISSNVYGAAMATYSDRTFGQSYDVLCTLPYTYNERCGNRLYDKIKQHMGIGVKVAQINPKNDNIKGTLYLRGDLSKWLGFSIKNVVSFSPYVTAGLYVNADKGVIKSQNLEYSAGFTFGPTIGKFPRWLSFNAGYEGFVRQSAYNNFYLGIRIYAMKTPLIYY